MSFISNFRKELQRRKVAAIKERQQGRTERQLARTEARMERKLAKRKLKKTYDGKFQDLETGETFTSDQASRMEADVVDSKGNVVQEFGTEEKVSSKTNPALMAGIIVGSVLLVGGTIFLIVRTVSKNK